MSTINISFNELSFESNYGCWWLSWMCLIGQVTGLIKENAMGVSVAVPRLMQSENSAPSGEWCGHGLVYYLKIGHKCPEIWGQDVQTAFFFIIVCVCVLLQYWSVSSVRTSLLPVSSEAPSASAPKHAPKGKKNTHTNETIKFKELKQINQVPYRFQKMSRRFLNNW